MAVQLPPWLNIDPTAPVDRLLRGYGEGRAAGAGQRQAEEHEIDRAYQAGQASEMMAYRQAMAQEETRQFNEQLRIRQKQAEMAAQEASIRIQAQRGYVQETRALIAQGVDAMTAHRQSFPKYAAGLMYKNPERLGEALQQSQGPPPPIFGKTPDGRDYMQNQRTGSTTLVPPVFTGPEERELPSGANMIRTGPQHWTVGQREGSLTRVQTERLRDLHNKERELAKSLGGLTQEEAATDPELSKVIKELNQIEEDRQAVYRGEWSPTGGTPKAAETKTKKATDADKAEAKQLVRQFPEKEARIKARFREAFGEDL